MKGMMEYLNERLPFFSGKTFYLIFSVAILGQPLAVWSQAMKAWMAASTVGISLFTFMTMLMLQLLGVGYGIRIREPVVFLAMAVSMVGSLVIISAVLFR